MRVDGLIGGAPRDPRSDQISEVLLYKVHAISCLQLRISPSAVQNLEGHIVKHNVEKEGLWVGFFKSLLANLII
jgi:hypothetical protein